MLRFRSILPKKCSILGMVHVEALPGEYDEFFPLLCNIKRKIKVSFIKRKKKSDDMHFFNC